MKTTGLIIAVVFLSANYLRANELPKQIFHCNAKSDGKHFVDFDNTKLRPVAYPDKKNLLAYLKRMSELNMGFPDGQRLVLEPNPPVGCAEIKIGNWDTIIKCLIGYDSSFNFSFELDDETGSDGTIKYKGSLSDEAANGGLTEDHYLDCEIESR